MHNGRRLLAEDAGRVHVAEAWCCCGPVKKVQPTALATTGIVGATNVVVEVIFRATMIAAEKVKASARWHICRAEAAEMPAIQQGAAFSESTGRLIPWWRTISRVPPFDKSRRCAAPPAGR